MTADANHQVGKLVVVVVVYHVTIVGHGLLKKFLPIGCVLRTAGSFLYLRLWRPASFVKTSRLFPHPGHE